MFDLISGNDLITTMDQSMRLASRRLGLIASNMANIDTPGYKTQDFSFQDALKQTLAGSNGQSVGLLKTHPGHIGPTSTESLPPTTDPIKAAYERNDRNDVNLDRESLLLARTQGTYQLSSSFMQTEIRRIYQVIREGSK
jgi:flagellar basal-body rod protein FlgB